MDNLNNLFEKAKNKEVETSFEATSNLFKHSLSIAPLTLPKAKTSFFSIKKRIIMTSVISSLAIISVLLFNQKTITKVSETKIDSNDIVKHTDDNNPTFIEIEEEKKTYLVIDELSPKELELKVDAINRFIISYNKYDEKKDTTQIKPKYIFPTLTAKEIKENNKRKKNFFNGKHVMKGFIYVPSGTFKYYGKKASAQAFYMQQTEVTNIQYKTFLFDLLIQGRKEEFIKAAPNQNGWIEMFGENAKPMTDIYFWHKSYYDYPVVNVSLEGAEMYCKWMTEENKKANPEERIKHHNFRIPNHVEWYRAAQGDLENNIYPWIGNKPNNKEGQALANYADNKTPDYLYTVKSYSYNPNGWGLYCMAGNVSEMAYYRTYKGIAYDYFKRDSLTQLIAAGGSWLDDKDNITIKSYKPANREKSKPTIGFRVVHSFYWKGISPQPLRTAYFENRLPVLNKTEIKKNNYEKNKLLKSIVTLDKNYFAALPTGSLKWKNDSTSIQSFLIQKEETSNAQYKVFLYDLLIQGKNDTYYKALPKFRKYNQYEKISKKEHTMKYPSYGPNFTDKYPINLISREGAELYCTWLNEELKKAYPKESFNPIRIPQRSEIQYADQYLKERKGNVILKNNLAKQGNYLINDSTTCNMLINGTSFFIGKCEFYYGTKSILGIKNLKGNLAEMCYDGNLPGTVGGSWADPKEQMDLFAPDNNAGIIEPRGNIGFRIVTTVTDNKSQKKFIKKYSSNLRPK